MCQHLDNLCNEPIFYNWVMMELSINKRTFKVQERQMDFNVTEYEKLIDFTLQIIFTKLRPVYFWCGSKEEWPQLSQKAIKIIFPSPAIYLCEAKFLSILNRAIYCNRLNAVDNTSIQSLSIKPDSRKTLKN